MASDRRILADEMLGRLARYLRCLGYDTEYARDLDDGAVIARARETDRCIVTRDRALAQGAGTGAILLTSLDIAGQIREMSTALPEFRIEPSFDRCTLCNARLVSDAPGGAPRPGEPSDGRSVFECPGCGHRYWAGSHTDRIRRDVRSWTGVDPA